MDDSSKQVVITKKTYLQDKYSKLLVMLAVFFISTICLLVSLFYQTISSQKFWEQNYILPFFIIGAYGYTFIFGLMIALFIKEYGGTVSNHYKKYEFVYNLIFILIVTISLLAIFYVIFGLGAIGPILGSLAALAIKWWIEHKVQKQNT